MPTYEYECKSCRHHFDLFQSMSDAVKRKCPKCGKATLERLIGTGAALIFKGSGFYQTDYRTESYKKSAEADKKPAETKSSETKTPDSKSKAADTATPSAKPDAASRAPDPTSAPKASEPKPPKASESPPNKGKSKR